MVVGAISMMRLAMISHLLEILRSSNGSIRYYRRSGINQVLQKALPGCQCASTTCHLWTVRWEAKGPYESDLHPLHRLSNPVINHYKFTFQADVSNSDLCPADMTTLPVCWPVSNIFPEGVSRRLYTHICV